MAVGQNAKIREYCWVHVNELDLTFMVPTRKSQFAGSVSLSLEKGDDSPALYHLDGVFGWSLDVFRTLKAMIYRSSSRNDGPDGIFIAMTKNSRLKRTFDAAADIPNAKKGRCPLAKMQAARL